MPVAMKGRKSSSTTSKKATRYDDTLFGQDTVELLLAISEGPIKGLADGAATFYVGDVPLLDKGTQTPNISNFELRFLKGTNPADSIKLNLGGISSTKNVGLELRTKNQQIVVQGDKPQIDYLDFRVIVNRLLALSTEGGEFPSSIQFQIEVKPRSSSVWQIPFNSVAPPPVENTSGGSNYRPGATSPGTIVNDTYRETYLQDTAPIAGKTINAVWFQSNVANARPKLWNGAAWVDPTALTGGNRSGYAIWTWTDFQTNAARTAWYSPTGTAPPPGTLAAGDYLVTPATGELVYSYNDTAWVGTQAFATSAVSAPGVITINGLARSSYPKEFRIGVTRINEPYDARLTRLSEASTKSIFADITFESIQQINRDPLSFPDLAVAWLTIKATDTFTSIPEFTGIYDGVTIPVPSNHTFDEATQLASFPGIWDGTFKIAYTTSPAWHAFNFIKNSRYGKNSYYPETPDQWDFYEFGKHCSAHGIRFNEYIQEPRSLNELINYIVGIAGGRYVDRGDGYSTVIWDADGQVAQAIFAPENTIEGSFTYSFTDVTERKNDFKVSFKNPGLNYREDRLRVWDQNTIDVVGRNAEEFVAVGCRDAEEAVRRGRLRLATALTEKTIVNFKTNRLGRYLLPFQVILIADDQSTNVMSGRVKNPDPIPAGTSVLPLRDQLYFEAGVSYSAQFNSSDGNGGVKVVSYPLTVTTPGQQTSLKLSTPLTEALPEYAVFAIGAPKPFRITSITPSDEDRDQVEITAIEVNRQKWAFVDGQVQLRDITGLQTGPLSKYVYPVTSAKITPETVLTGGLNLLLTWSPSETKLIRGYRVYQALNGQPMELVYESNEQVYRLIEAKAGTYTFSIVAVGLDGTTESAPVTVQYIVANSTSLRSVVAPKNLHLVDEPETPIFRAINPSFAWDESLDPLVSKYRVDVLNPSNALVHTETVFGTKFFYSLIANQADNGGTALRSFTVRLRAVDSIGNLSEPVFLAVSHPAPAAVVASLEYTGSSVVVSFENGAPDVQGALVWITETPGFNPAVVAPYADTSQSPLFIRVSPNKNYYVRVALYDSYGKTGLNYSAEATINTAGLGFDTTDPGIPQNLALTTTSEIGPDGTLSSKITAAWTALTTANLGTYEVAYALGASPSDGAFLGGNLLTGNSISRSGFIPGLTYSVRVRSISQNGFGRSGWSTVKTITAALNLTPPANPTSFAAVGSFEAANLSWALPADKDLLGLEIWAGTTSVLASASKLATVPYPGTFYRDPIGTTATKFYWVRSINTSGTVASAFVGPQQATSAAIASAQIAAGAIGATQVAAGLEIPGVVTTLPAVAGYTGPGLVRLTSDGKLYRLVSGVWSKAVDGADLVANSIVTGSIAAGAVGATQIAAQAITGSKLAITSQNLAFNADGSQGTFNFEFYSPPGVNFAVGEDTQAPTSFKRAYAYVVNPLNDGQFIEIRNKKITTAGGKSDYPVLGGQWYEFSASFAGNTGANYVQFVFYKANGDLAGIYSGNSVGQAFTIGGPVDTYARSWVKAQAPADATTVVLRAIAQAVGTQNAPFVVGFSAWMFGSARADQSEPSPYVDWQITAINGGTVITGTLNATSIVAGSMTTDRFTAGTIDGAIIKTRTLTADMIKVGELTAGIITVGDGTISSFINGTNSAKLSPTALSVNSISANYIKAGSRGITTYGMEFNWPRDGNGNYTNVLTWTAGNIRYIDNNNIAQSVDTSAGSIAWTGAGNIVVWWNAANPTVLQSLVGSLTSVLQNPDNVILCQSNGVGQIAAIYGATIIDGTKITTLSIDTAQLRANAITADKISALAITAGKIAADAVAAINIQAGAITAKHVLLRDTGNSLTNGDFFDGTSNGWAYINGSIDTAGAQDPGGIHRLVSTNNISGQANPVAVQPGDVLYLSAMVYNSRAAGNAYLQVNWNDGANVFISASYPAQDGSKNGWVRLEGQAVAPAGAQSAVLLLRSEDSNNTAVYYGRVQLRRANGASLIVDGSIVASKISVGLNQGNLLYNSDCKSSSANYGQYYFGSTAVASAGVYFYPTGSIYSSVRSLGCIQQYITGTPNGGSDLYLNSYDVAGSQNSYFPVIPNGRYEFSAYINTYRTSLSSVRIAWVDINKNYISEAFGSLIYSSNAAINGNFAASTRSVLFAAAPSNAVYCQLTIRTNYDGVQQNPDVYVTGFYFAPALINQNFPSPWSPSGQTVIDGGAIRATSITADRMNVISLSAISANVGTVTAGVLQSPNGKTVLSLNGGYLAIYD